MSSPRLSIIIPAYNEAPRISPTIAVIWNYFKNKGESVELIVVDDGSADGTASLVENLRLHYPGLRCLRNGKNRGKGFSVRRAFLETRGELVLFTDADLSTPIVEWEKLRLEVERGASIAIGSRGLRGSRITRHQPLCREIMGKTFNRIVRLLAVRGIRDTQCGFKLFRRRDCIRLFDAQRVDRFAFDVELLFLAEKAGLKVAEAPVEWSNSPFSKVGLIRDSSQMLLDVIGIRIRYHRGRYLGF